MTPLEESLIQRIHATGPITVADYMNECLLHPQHGYYVSRPPFGRDGDFTTAPEISQMFGEVIGLCLAQAWIDQGRPNPMTLAEIGPGRGTLMADILRATKAVPGFHAAADIVLIEASNRLRSVQAKTLAGCSPRWLAHSGELRNQPLFFVANEFFDALPIRQFVRANDNWHERQIGLHGDALAFGLSAPTSNAYLERRVADTTPGDVVEICPSAPAIIADIAVRIGTHGGAAVIIDYGNWRSKGDTLQALQHHQMVRPLHAPGLSDITAHVDFEALSGAVADMCETTTMTPQGVFLERLGITARAQALAQTMTGDTLTQHIAAHRRLTHPDEMGQLFKVMGLYPRNATPPPGLIT